MKVGQDFLDHLYMLLQKHVTFYGIPDHSNFNFSLSVTQHPIFSPISWKNTNVFHGLHLWFTGLFVAQWHITVLNWKLPVITRQLCYLLRIRAVRLMTMAYLKTVNSAISQRHFHHHCRFQDSTQNAAAHTHTLISQKLQILASYAYSNTHKLLKLLFLSIFSLFLSNQSSFPLLNICRNCALLISQGSAATCLKVKWVMSYRFCSKFHMLSSSTKVLQIG